MFLSRTDSRGAMNGNNKITKGKHVFFGSSKTSTTSVSQKDSTLSESTESIITVECAKQSSKPQFAIRETETASYKLITNKKELPKGWISLPEFGDAVVGTKFIPIKCPLSPYKYQYPNNFHLESFIAYQKKQGRIIGAIIDLTNTDKYYDPSRDVPHGIKYLKLKSKGHDEAPARSICNKFNDIVNQFHKDHQDQYIIVHCTHGLNRTGFMIINYMCSYLEKTVDEAIDDFYKARPPGIYNPLFIDTLYEMHNCTDSKRYQKMDYAPAPYWSAAKVKLLIEKRRLWSKRNAPLHDKKDSKHNRSTVDAPVEKKTKSVKRKLSSTNGNDVSDNDSEDEEEAIKKRQKKTKNTEQELPSKSSKEERKSMKENKKKRKKEEKESNDSEDDEEPVKKKQKKTKKTEQKSPSKSSKEERKSMKENKKKENNVSDNDSEDDEEIVKKKQKETKNTEQKSPSKLSKDERRRIMKENKKKRKQEKKKRLAEEAALRALNKKPKNKDKYDPVKRKQMKEKKARWKAGQRKAKVRY